MLKIISRVCLVLITISVIVGTKSYTDKIKYSQMCRQHKYVVVSTHGYTQSRADNNKILGSYTTYHRKCTVCGDMNKLTLSDWE